MVQLFKAKVYHNIQTSQDLEKMKIGDTAPYSYEGEHWAFKHTSDGFTVYNEDSSIPTHYDSVHQIMVDFIDLGISWK